MRLMSYQLHKLIRRPQTLPAYCLYIVSIVTLYSYKGVQATSSYTLSHMLLFPIVLWIGALIAKQNSSNERYILLIHMQSKRYKYVLGTLWTSFVIALPLVLFAIVYPIVIRVFSQMPTVAETVTAVITHVLSALFGVVIGSYVLLSYLQQRKFIWLLLILFGLLTFLKPIFIEQFSFMKLFLWILPPFTSLNQLMIQVQTFHAVPWLVCILYLIISSALLLFSFNRSEI